MTQIRDGAPAFPLRDCQHEDWKAGIAHDCYAMADAMLAAREVQP